MNAWDGILWAAFGTGLIALASESVALKLPDRRWNGIARRATVATAGLLSAAFLYLCLLFLALDLSVEYVWTYTADWVRWPYRLAGAWTGREGSLLMWTAFMAITAAVMAVRHRHPSPGSIERTPRAWTRVVMLALLALFLLAVARQGTFSPTPDFMLTGRPTGNGINPTLVSPFILIHPPLMFVAYALTIVPAAASIAHLITGTGRWSRIAGAASRLDWVIYTFAMGLGGMWAYFTLGFGGYWAWDPVEVANLLPWLALTIYLHAQMMHGRRGDFAAVGPMLGILPFVLTVFSTVSTRSGLWVSVHAFTDPTNAFNPDAAGRLLGILGVDASLGPYFGILLGTLLVGAALWCRRLALDHGTLARASRVVAGVLGAACVLAFVAPIAFLAAVFEIAALTGAVGLASLGLLVLAMLAAASPMLVADDATGPARNWVSVRGLAMLAVLLLSLGLVVSILWHFAAVNGWSEAFWDARIPWITTPIALALIVLLVHVPHGKQRALQVAGASLVLALMALLTLGLGAYALVLGVATAAAGIARLAHVATAGDRTARTGSMLLWAAALLDVIFWLNPPASVFLGAFEPRWPVQVPMGAAAVAALAGAHLVGMGRPSRWPYILAGVLGGFYVAAPLALAAWMLHRRSPVPTKPWKPARARVVAVYGVHFVVGLLFVGYAASTYGEAKISGEWDVGEPIDVDGTALRISGVDRDPGSVERFTVHADVDGRIADGVLHYEPSAGAYYPLPAALRLWDRDIYIQVDALCFQPAEACTADDWVTAYEPSLPAFEGGDVQGVRLTLHSLPGISLIWAALFLFLAYGIPIALIRDPAISGSVQKPRSEPSPSS